MVNVNEFLDGFIPDENKNENKKTTKENQNQTKENQVKNVKESKENERDFEKKQISSKEDLDKVTSAILTLEEELDIEETTVDIIALRDSIAITPIISEEEIQLDTNRLSLYHFSKKINKILLNHTKAEYLKKDENKVIFTNPNRFEQEILPIDRTFLLYGLIMISFEKLTEFQNVCENCEKEYIADFNVKNTNFEFKKNNQEILNTNYYQIFETQSILNGLIEFDLGFNTEIIRLKLLENTNTEKVKDNLEKRNLLLDVLDNLLLYVKNIRVYKKDKRKKEGKKLVVEFNILNELEKTREFIEKLPMKVKEAIIHDIKLDNIMDYMPDFYVNITCPFCGHVEKMPFSPEIEFFRKALSISGGQ